MGFFTIINWLKHGSVTRVLRHQVSLNQAIHPAAPNTDNRDKWERCTWYCSTTLLTARMFHAPYRIVSRWRIYWVILLTAMLGFERGVSCARNVSMSFNCTPDNAELLIAMFRSVVILNCTTDSWWHTSKRWMIEGEPRWMKCLVKFRIIRLIKRASLQEMLLQGQSLL